MTTLLRGVRPLKFDLQLQARLGYLMPKPQKSKK
jgi:hypothetical protein